MEIAGKAALLTGAGSGIGRASVHALAVAGARITVAGIQEADGAGIVRSSMQGSMARRIPSEATGAIEAVAARRVQRGARGEIGG